MFRNSRLSRPGAFLFLFSIIWGLLLISSCRKNDSDAKVKITVDSVKLLGINAVVVYSHMENFSNPGERGVCWNTYGNAHIQNNKKINTGPGDSFIDTIANLEHATKFFIKTYVFPGSWIVF